MSHCFAGATLRGSIDGLGRHPEGFQEPGGHAYFGAQHVDAVGDELRVLSRGESSLLTTSSQLNSSRLDVGPAFPQR